MVKDQPLSRDFATEGLVIGLLPFPTEGSDLICNRQVRILLFTTGLALCSIDGSANDLAGQVKAIQNLEREGHLPEAIIESSKLIDALKRSDPQSLLIPEALDRRASLEQDLGRWAEAEHDYAQAITLWQPATSLRPLSLARELNNLASLYSSGGQFKKAEDLRRRSLALRVEFSGSDSPEVALCLSNLAADLFGQGEYTESAGLCRRALDIWAKGAPERDRSDLALNTLALVELRNQHVSNGLSLAFAALKKYEASQNPRKAQVAAYEHTIAVAREANGQLAEAQQDFASALKTLEGTEHPPAIEQYNLFTDYARLLFVLHRKREAKDLVRKAHTEISKLDRTASQRYTVDVNALVSKH
ncbi:MAG: tetratricopeptide repeat protein [Acidobacteriaceae bacterium]|nr:tetratricopeptide repeat protein [Acidobacteriaceae bacterium]